MTVTNVTFQTAWELDRDKDGHREYKITHEVLTNDPLDGPQTVMDAPGLPLIGSIWSFDNDSDPFAFCWPNMKVTPRIQEKGTVWDVEQLFSTKPLRRCQDESIEDPLLEPQRISGGFVKYTEAAITDKDGVYLRNSSHEQLRGPPVEFDQNRPTVRIEQNVPRLELELFTRQIDTVNDATLWGLTSRKIKLSNASWERKFFGLCGIYFTRIFEFDINFNTFDRTETDKGTRVLNGHYEVVAGTGSCTVTGWILDNVCGAVPDKNNPQHFTRYKDRNGENTQVILDGNGEPADGVGTGPEGPGQIGTISIQVYQESNFLLLGIPVDLEA